LPLEIWRIWLKIGNVGGEFGNYVDSFGKIGNCTHARILCGAINEPIKN
jgi:hypothetical protein